MDDKENRTERTLPRTPADEANAFRHVSPSTEGDSERSPLLEQAHRNVAETDYADEAAKDNLRLKNKPQ